MSDDPHVGAGSVATPAPLSFTRGGPLCGRVTVPGDKSVSHRALLLGAMARGTTTIKDLLEGEDVLATARVVSALGAQVSRADGGYWHLRGTGVGALLDPEMPLDFGNAGTGVRLSMGVIAGHGLRAMLTGDASLCRRPMGRVLHPLIAMGAQVFEADIKPGARAADIDRLPFVLQGPTASMPITYRLPVASAQVKSAILLAAVNTPGTTTVIETTPTRDHTERMLKGFGADISVSTGDDGVREIVFRGPACLCAQEVMVPGDPSSAAFLIVAALLRPGSDLIVENVMLNKTRTGLLTTLRDMGGRITIANERHSGGERIGDIRVRGSRLRGVRVPAERAASMIDEYPILAVAAAAAEGETQMLGLDELRVKESDRLAAIAAGLAANRIAHEQGAESLLVRGTGGAIPGGGMVATHMDHRIAMAFLVMGTISDRPVTVDDHVMITTSFPGFVATMKRLAGKKIVAA